MANKDKQIIKKAYALVDKINDLESKYSIMSNLELKSMTQLFRERLANGETLDDLLPDAFAVVREASKRVLDMRHFDVQLVGGIMLHKGHIAEMKTGEGKTLVATLPVYLNALTEKGVHVVTANDYLAERDKELMEKLYNFLGMTTGVILSGQSPHVKREQYQCDITYGTNNEFGFDYLRDNMAMNPSLKVQRELNFAIIDEVDSILVDEARTPLIISAPAKDANELYLAADQFVRTLDKEDYSIDEKQNSIALNDSGINKAESFFGMEDYMDMKNCVIQHHINQALRAHYRMRREVDYLVRKGEVVIVDEFTGRTMQGRRYSDGLHQAIEAKEKVEIQKESKTLATITYQNYFRLYKKLAGMTGTAKTEEEEFSSIYNLNVVVIPTNKPIARIDHIDRVYTSKEAKVRAIITEIKKRHSIGQPLLVGTISIEDSELISQKLKKEGIKHEVLNAKNHEKEASIIAQAGRLNSVTISTNMAGRGTDILIGGNATLLAREALKKEYKYTEEQLEILYSPDKNSEEHLEILTKYNELLEHFNTQTTKEYENVIKAGGLCVIGTERHESRRIDNQLRGRAGRQGDLGESVFFVSLEDDLMRIFGGEKIKKVADKLGLEDDTPLDNKLISNNIEYAQKKVESNHFSVRKQVVKYDDVLNEQRKTIYSFRDSVMSSKNLENCIFNMMDEVAEDVYNRLVEEKGKIKKWNLDEIESMVSDILPLREEIGLNNLSKVKPDIIKTHIKNVLVNEYTTKLEILGNEALNNILRHQLLNIIDSKWMEHIETLNNLKEGIHLRSFGQEDPVVAYRTESSNIYDNMTISIAYELIDNLLSA